jgi:FkbM family methyltransferase
VRKFINKFLASRGYEFNKIGRTIYFLDRLAKKQGEISFIQVGANDGISFDNIYPFFKSRKCKGLLIEPLPYFFDRLKFNYADSPNIIPLNIALHPTAEKFDIYSVNPKELHKYPHWVSGIASFNKEHLIKNSVQESDLVIEAVTCKPLSTLIEEYELLKLDYLQIDTEGFDDEIIKMINFNQVKPKLIKFESVHLSSEKKLSTVNLLKSQGYKIIDERRDMVALLEPFFN